MVCGIVTFTGSEVSRLAHCDSLAWFSVRVYRARATSSDCSGRLETFTATARAGNARAHLAGLPAARVRLPTDGEGNNKTVVRLWTYECDELFAVCRKSFPGLTHQCSDGRCKLLPFPCYSSWKLIWRRVSGDALYMLRGSAQERQCWVVQRGLNYVDVESESVVQRSWKETFWYCQ